MLPEAKSEELVYIANYSYNNVRVYSYPAGKLVGSLAGKEIYTPDGVCIDRNNNIWIVNNAPNPHHHGAIVEYAHGGTHPIATLSNPGEYSETCSVDPTNGDLAVTAHDSYSNGPGSVAIYRGGQGSPETYVDPKIKTMYFCGYDPEGNLYVDGFGPGAKGFQLAELPLGKKTFTSITLKGGTIYFPGQIQWDGKHLAVGDQEAGFSSPYTYSAIYQTTGAGGKIVGETILKGSFYVAGFWIQGDAVVAPNVSEFASQSGGNVYIYKYPGGGKPVMNLKKGFNEPLGAAISP